MLASTLRLCCTRRSQSGNGVAYPCHRWQTLEGIELFFYTSNPLTNPPASVSRAWAMRRMLWRLRLRWPRSTWPMYDQCRVVRSASFSCDRPSCSRRARTRRPNSPVAGESGGLRSVGTAPSQPAEDSQSRDYVSHDDVFCCCP